MTLQISLCQQLESRLQEEASRRGLSVEECAQRVLQQHLPAPLPSDNGESLREMLARWNLEDENEPDDGYDVIAAMNAWRVATGQRPLIPPVDESKP